MDKVDLDHEMHEGYNADNGFLAPPKRLDVVYSNKRVSTSEMDEPEDITNPDLMDFWVDHVPG